MDNRSKKLAEIFGKLQAAIGRGDICAPYSVAPGTEPDVELTIRIGSNGQVLRFNLWRAEIEQWRDTDPMTNTPVSGPVHLKIIGDIAKMEKIPLGQGN